MPEMDGETVDIGVWTDVIDTVGVATIIDGVENSKGVFSGVRVLSESVIVGGGEISVSVVCLVVGVLTEYAGIVGFGSSLRSEDAGGLVLEVVIFKLSFA